MKLEEWQRYITLAEEEDDPDVRYAIPDLKAMLLDWREDRQQLLLQINRHSMAIDEAEKRTNELLQLNKKQKEHYEQLVFELRERL